MVEEHHLIIVRAGAQKAQMLLLCATSTWVAYNCWGGANAHDGKPGADGQQFSPILTTQRPWTRGFCRLPEGAPRAVPHMAPLPGDIVRYPYMEWAYSYGYSRKYASAGWASYERHFTRWAEAEGFDHDVATLHDLDADMDLLQDYKCVVIVGHDEYWSRNMRLAMDNWIETGGKLARFAGNFLWQVRLEDAGRKQVCYKHNARDMDPVQGTDKQNMLTTAWEASDLNWPGVQTVGVNGARGVSAGMGYCVGQGSGGFTIYRPEHWVFDQTYLGYGDVLGSASRIYGSEVDGLDLVIEEGLPYTTGEDGAAEEITILGLGFGRTFEADHGIWGESLLVGDAQVAWRAETLFGVVTDDTMDRASRGNGVIIHWPRKRGEVFTAATSEWVMGLKRRDPQVEQVTRNVLRRFCD